MARSTATKKNLPQIYSEVKRKVEDMLSLSLKCSPASLTVDIWTDRVMRTYLGVTAHAVSFNSDSTSLNLRSFPLKFQRFKGKHTGERIATVLHEMLSEIVGLQDNVYAIVTDNAANMRAAFEISFPLIDEPGASQADLSGEDEERSDEEECIFENLRDEDDREVSCALDSMTPKRLSCFAHTLQLTINDGLINIKSMSGLLAKASRLSTLLHRSTIFRER